MAQQQLDGLLISVPENIYYLTGLDHWGFFACHVLLVPLEGPLALMCRKMEKITVQNQLDGVEFYGHEDKEEPADYVVKMLKDRSLDKAKIGIEKRSLSMTPRIYEMILDRANKVEFSDSSGLMDDIRLVKSSLEQDYTRRAAAVADAGTLAAIEAIKDGASDLEVSAECHRAQWH